MTTSGVVRAGRQARAATLGLALPIVLLGGCTAYGDADVASTSPEASISSQASAPSEPTEAITRADADWMAGMAAHHDQAVALAELAAGRAGDAEVLASADRIAASQAAEAAALRAWSDEHGFERHEVGHGDEGMPGEISATTFSRAATASGTAFDRIFLDAMISHHEGAVQMSEARLAVSGEPAVTRWARAVAAGQAIEIDRLRELRARLPAE